MITNYSDYYIFFNFLGMGMQILTFKHPQLTEIIKRRDSVECFSKELDKHGQHHKELPDEASWMEIVSAVFGHYDTLHLPFVHVQANLLRQIHGQIYSIIFNYGSEVQSMSRP